MVVGELQADSFQEDIFPDCPSGEAALTVEEWVGGTDKDPLLMALGGGAASTGPVKVCMIMWRELRVTESVGWCRRR